jgi:hypothetical protein
MNRKVFSLFSLRQPLNLLSMGCLQLLLLTPVGCMRREFAAKNEAMIQDTKLAGRNGGFRILPATAARDALRPRVIYRCNDVACGDAFQPSNEERDLFFPCDLVSTSAPDGKLQPYLRLVSNAGARSFMVKTEHKQACSSARPFAEVLSEGASAGVSVSPQGTGEGCRQFRSQEEACLANAAQGCRWVVHPSGRSGGGVQGDCVGLFRSSVLPNGTEKVQSLRPSSLPNQWLPVEQYR